VFAVGFTVMPCSSPLCRGHGKDAGLFGRKFRGV
jgi:hypothetical protein